MFSLIESMTKIKNIIFDLGGVILNLDYSKTVEEFNKIGFFNFEKVYNQKKQSKIFDDFEKGEISNDKFISLIQQSEKLKIDENDFINAWNAMLLEIPKERIEFIKKLKKDYNIFLLSNTNEIHIKKFEADLRKKNWLNDFHNCFEQIYYSSNIGMRKPDEDCFIKIIEDHNLIAHETLFIDDSIQHIEGAKKVGINAFLLKKENTILQLVPDIIQSEHHK